VEKREHEAHAVRIAFDVGFIFQEKTGIGHAAQQLVEGLERIAPGHHYIVLDNAPIANGFSLGRFRKGALRKVLYTTWQNTYLPLWLQRQGIHLVHAPNFIPPLVKACATVITVHDVAFLCYPEAYDPSYLHFLRTMLPRALRAADHIITVSENTRRDLLRHYGVSPSKVGVVYNGVGEIFLRRFDHETLEAKRREYGLPEKFILSVGTIEPRKNFGLLVEAFACLKLREKMDHQLVLVGKKDRDYPAVAAIIAKYGLQSEVHLPGWVPVEDLAAIYQLADLLAYPSLYEGFGLPLLEAMASGLPVIASNVSAIPEVVGDAALLVSPTDPEELTNAMRAALREKSLREELAEKGLKRARKFSWDRAAENTLRIYERLQTRTATETL